MQTILGSTGIIGRLTAKELAKYTDKIRLVSRNPKKVNNGDELVIADLTDISQVRNAVNGSDTVYVTAGLKYNIKVWEALWPQIIKNVISTCRENKSKLVFFDNVYALGFVKGPMKENTSLNPVSKKGHVRKLINKLIMDEVEKGKLDAMIIRSADFYGYEALSFVNAMVFDKLVNNKKPQWLVNDEVKHSFTYTPDAAKATALLGNTPSAFNQVWHAPSDRNALTGKEFIEICCDAAGKPKDYSVISKSMIRLLGIFNGFIKESIEMLYQNEHEYLFDSSKFENTFNFKPTTYLNGITEIFKLTKD